jgi:hypothetical protein
MFSVDLSKAFPDKVFVYSAAFIPGLFFEISLLLANPEFVAKILVKPQIALTQNIYMELAIILFLAFVIGNAFMLLVMPVLQLLVQYIYRFSMFLQRGISRLLVIPFLNWFLKKPRWRNRQWLHGILRRFNALAFPHPGKQAGVEKCWREFARKLLKNQYGVNIDDLRAEWNWLYGLIGTPSEVEIRGLVIMIALQATGLCGLVAIRLAPALRNGFYVAFCVFLFCVGLIHSVDVARRRIDPLYFFYARTRALLREYPKMSAELHVQPESNPDSQDGVT